MHAAILEWCIYSYIAQVCSVQCMHLWIVFTAISSWYVQPSKASRQKKVAERDFIALNRASVQCGLTTAQEQAQFRATHDIRRRDDADRSTAATPKFPSDMVFGISTRLESGRSETVRLCTVIKAL